MWTRYGRAASTAIAAGVFVVSGCAAEDSTAHPEKKQTDAPSVSESESESASASTSASPTPASSPSPSASRPLTAAQLKSLLLRKQDVPQADSAPVQGPVRRYDPEVRVTGRDCQKVFDTLVAQHASTSVIQDFWWRNNRWAARTWLASYPDADAPQQFQRLKEGLTTCGTLRGKTPEGTLNSRITPAKAPALGDEAVAFALSMTGPNGTVLTDHHTLVRVGALTVDISDRGAQHAPRFPLDVVIDKQLARLTRGLST
ncbi:hypothetical protein [Streptomyces sp. NPDC059063]|uniref:hypothetical protein n=1 Tax=unclassified Streptomyces TaxID=2593676 RepID=UPI00369421F5